MSRTITYCKNTPQGHDALWCILFLPLFIFRCKKGCCRYNFRRSRKRESGHGGTHRCARRDHVVDDYYTRPGGIRRSAFAKRERRFGIALALKRAESLLIRSAAPHEQCAITASEKLCASLCTKLHMIEAVLAQSGCGARYVCYSAVAHIKAVGCGTPQYFRRHHTREKHRSA